MPRFFIKSEDISEGVAVIRGQDAFHIARSLRMAVGDSITVSDGEGVDYNVKLTKIRDEECLGDIVSSHASLVESPALISLYVAYPKGDKLETVIQKAVELGANRIIPFESSRCIKRPKAEKCDKLLLRLNRIAEEAAKQCGRARLPSVCAPMDFKSAIAEAAKSELSLFCYENEDGYSIKDAIKKSDKPKTVSVTVGAEGGFSPDEADYAKEAGLTSVTLGPRILRCETAPLYALAALSYEIEL
jgi:16S rRNA (uracil1498-N3)-methyltransferase